MQKLLIEEVVTAVIVFVMFLITVLNVIARYILKVPFGWSEEITMSLFVWATMMGASAACARNENLGFSLLVDMIPPRQKRIFQIITQVITVFFFLFIVWNGSQMVQNEISLNMVTPVGRFPEWVFGIAIPIGAAFFIFRTVQKIIRLAKGGEPTK